MNITLLSNNEVHFPNTLSENAQPTQQIQYALNFLPLQSDPGKLHPPSPGKAERVASPHLILTSRSELRRSHINLKFLSPLTARNDRQFVLDCTRHYHTMTSEIETCFGTNVLSLLKVILQCRYCETI